MNDIEVSVIIVCRNEANYLSDCIRSVRRQFIGLRGWELIIVDGMSIDSTRQKAHDLLSDSGVTYSILDNPGKTLAKGWNIGINYARGAYIIRPDAHSELMEGYITGALQNLKQYPEAGAVGGKLETRAKSLMGKIIGEALSMRTGVGNSSFRTGGNSGFMDTVVYGLYRREVFQKAGQFNESLVRHQDTEFHHRIIKAGFKLFYDNRLTAVYYCRESVKAIMNQMFLIGYYFSTLLEHDSGTSLKPRHLAPLFFWLGLILLFIGTYFIPVVDVILATVVLLYIGAIAVEAFLRFISAGRYLSLAAVFIVPLLHVSYAAGTFSGLMSYIFRRSL